MEEAIVSLYRNSARSFLRYISRLRSTLALKIYHVDIVVLRIRFANKPGMIYAIQMHVYKAARIFR